MWENKRRKDERGNETKRWITEVNAPDGKAGKTEDVGCVIWCQARRGRRRMQAESLTALGRHVKAELKALGRLKEGMSRLS